MGRVAERVKEAGRMEEVNSGHVNYVFASEAVQSGLSELT